jgi:hypothetical protein
MTKKYTAFILLSTTLFSLLPWQVRAENNTSMSLKEILGEQKWEEIVKKIDALSKKIVQNEKTTLKVETVLAEKSITLQKKEERSKQEEISRLVLSYLWEQIANQKKEKYTPLDAEKLWAWLNKEEKESVNTRVLSFQQSLFNDSLKYNELSYSLSEFSGKFGAQIRMDQDFFGKFGASMELSDILWKINGLDSELTGKLKIDVTQSEQKNGFEGDIHFIEKEKEQFIKIKNVTITWTGNEMTEAMEEQLTKAVENGKFIRVKKSAEETVNGFGLISGQDVEQIKNSLQENLPNTLQLLQGKPLFIANKKINNTYILVPSIDFCTLLQSVSTGKWQECGKNEYNYMLQEYQDLWMTLGLKIEWQKTTLTLLEKEEQVEVFGKVEIQNNQIETLSLDIIPNQDQYKWQGISLNYRENRLDIKVKIEEFMFWARINGTAKEFSWKYAFSVVGSSAVEWTIQGGQKNEESMNLDITLNGKNIITETDTLSGNLKMNLSDLKNFIFNIEGSYKEGTKEVFFGKLNYDFILTPKEAVQIQAPTDFIDIEELEQGAVESTNP